nr:unnamed protein product [Spirometra erinaceieuropaei]
MQFFLFSITNPLEFIRGDRPVVQQHGPFTYHQRQERVDVSLNPENGTISYSDRKFYVFDRNLSGADENITITTLNLAYIAVAEKSQQFPTMVSFVMRILELYYNENLFVNKTARELIWGYKDPVLEIVKKLIPIQTEIGIFVGKNGTEDGTYVIRDGFNNPEELGQIVSYHNSSSVSCWRTDWANMINGSDGSLIPPFRSQYDKIYLFAADVCRSFTFTAQGSSLVREIPTIVFKLSRESLLSPDLNPDNAGFCIDYPNCPKSGVLNMSTCLHGAPVVVSLPHFYQADESYQKAVIGLHPTEDMITRLDVEPHTGIVLRAEKQLQVNGVVRRNDEFPSLRHVRDTFFPVAYFKESFTAPEDIAAKLRDSLFVPLLTAKIVSICLISLASVSLGILFLVFLLRRRPATELVLSVSEPNDQRPLMSDTA